MSDLIAIAFAARRPNKVNRLVLHGTYAKGEKLAKKKVQHAIISMIEASWGIGSKTLADIFTPDANAEQKAGDRVRITMQLIDSTTDFHMWSES